MGLPHVAPSILSSDFAEIGAAVRSVEQSGADWLHLDVMDGTFVPAITFGSKLVSDLRSRSSLFFDVHLMVNEPWRHVEAFAASGADAITFHLEACVHSHRLLGRIRELGKKAGISIVPSTPAAALSELLSDVDLVLVMTVDPGAGGQKLIPRCLEKVADLSRARRERGADFLLAVDGGIGSDTAKAALDAGADVLVMGNAFFRADDKAALVASTRSRGRAC